MSLTSAVQPQNLQPGIARSRLYFLDNLRSFVVLLVVVFHAAMAFMLYVPKWWYVIDTQQSLGFTIFVIIADVFIMPIMFLVAGYFGIQSLARKSHTEFWRDKGRRIVAPWIAGVLVLAPFLTYFVFLSRSKTPPNYFYFWFHIFFQKMYQQAHYWFLGALALFYLALFLACTVFPRLKALSNRSTRNPVRFLAGFLVANTAVFLLVHQFTIDTAWIPVGRYLLMIQPTRFSLYVFYFALGVYAYRQRWFGTDGYRPDPEFWSAMATALGLAVVVHKLAYGSQLGLFSVRVVNDLLHCSFCLSITLALLGVFQIRFDRTSPLATSMAANSYAIYFIHQLIVQPLNLAIRPLHCNILLKYLVVAVPAVVLCYLISRYVLAKLPPFAMRRSLQQSAAL